jgi:hypothetical protein
VVFDDSMFAEVGSGARRSVTLFAASRLWFEGIATLCSRAYFLYLEGVGRQQVLVTRSLL